LLRVLSGIYPPDAGKVTVKGPIGALIAASAGFHPDMTGRENIYLNGAIVGLKKKEIDEKLEEIIEFAELGPFIDTPVRFYSSGMYVRLGFAIAVNIRPRILLIDEILSVGDITFQNKCFRKLKELRDSVDAVLFVSHNLDHVRNICVKLIILDEGKIMYYGEVEEGILKYQTHADRLKQKNMGTEFSRKTLPGAFSFDSSDVELLDVRIRGSAGKSDGEITSGDDLILDFNFAVQKEVARPQFSVGIVDEKNTQVIWQLDHDNGIRFDSLVPGNYRLTVIFQDLNLAAGVYRVDLAIRNTDSCEVLLRHLRIDTFRVRTERISRGLLNVKSRWDIVTSGSIGKGDT
jgi:lipopolysaccharide transport system ATP-binding protein